jgi:hypothetical protein
MEMGRHEYVPPKEFMGNHILTGVKDDQGKPIIITSGEALGYFDEAFWAYYNMYARVEILGSFPNGSVGWANEPVEVVRAVRIFRSEQNAIDAEKMEKVKSKNDHGS